MGNLRWKTAHIIRNISLAIEIEVRRAQSTSATS